MIQHLIIKLGVGGKEIVKACAFSADGTWQDNLDISNLSAGKYRDCSIVIDGQDVSVFRQTVPDLSPVKLRKILPTLAADLIADDIADQHFALWSCGESNTEKLIAVVQHTVIKTALKTCKRFGVVPNVVVPDFCLLSAEQNEHAILDKDGMVHVRLPDGTGYTIEKDLAGEMLGSVEVKQLSYNAERELLTGALNAKENLLQGEYAPQAIFSEMLFMFRRAALLFLVLSVLWVSSMFYDISDREAQTNELYSQAENTFNKSFPHIKRIVNVEAQARQELVKLQAVNRPEFLLLSETIFIAVQETQNTLLEGLRFDANRGEMAITLSFNSFADGDEFKRRIQQKNIQIDEGSSRQEGNRIFTDITLRSGQ